MCDCRKGCGLYEDVMLREFDQVRELGQRPNSGEDDVLDAMKLERQHEGVLW